MSPSSPPAEAEYGGPLDLPARLARRLAQPLPGRVAQERFSPELCHGRHFDRPPAGARRAAVALLLYPGPAGWLLPLVLRPASMKSHAGQIALPGGVIDPGETDCQAALRELHEELGVPAASVRPLGALSGLLVFVTNFWVTPWVAVLDQPPHFVPSPDEVADVLEVPLPWLLDRDSQARGLRTERGITFSAPYWEWRGRQIWGATAMILGELEAVLRECGGVAGDCQ
ncbi:MAG: CoA pyrophosphatase [Pirellulales bacterium]